MKMVSQLTRQAMSRHRLLSTVTYPDSPASISSVSELGSVPLPSPVQTLYPQEVSVSYPAQPLPSAAPVQIPQQRTIYGELMKKHDRFTERHLTAR